MKLSASKLLAVVVACVLVSGVCLGAVDDTPPPLGENPSPVPSVSPSPAAVKPGKKPKAPLGPNDTPRPPKIKKPKPIPFPLPIGENGKELTIPENSISGQLLSQIMAMKVHRRSNEIIEMESMKMDLYHPDGKEDFHIILPASVFNLETHIINSEQPVTVQTQDFELTGDKMEFNTVDRTGQLLGHVHMTIHNLKQVAGPQQPPTP